jgi:hypothetical protein
MNVTFTGIQNVGYLRFKTQDKEFRSIERMVFEVTGQDFVDCEKILKEHPAVNKPGFIQVDFFAAFMRNPVTRTRYAMLINSNPVYLDTKNIPLLSLLGSKIKKIPTQQLEISKEYFKSDLYLKNCFGSDNIEFAEKGKSIFEKVHDPDNVKIRSTRFSKFIRNYKTDIMTLSN